VTPGADDAGQVQHDHEHRQRQRADDAENSPTTQPAIQRRFGIRAGMVSIGMGGKTGHENS
jgi:class 3 adenylate cyclase